MESIWHSTESLPDRKKLEENIHVQNAVIGAGMAGILTAYMLKKKGQHVIVIEADRVAGGQTKNTTAKITSQHDLIYDELIKKAGIRRAEGYAKANEAAISEYEKIVRNENVECHFEKLPAYLYTREDTGKQKLLKEAQAAKSLGIKAQFVNGDEINELPFKVSGAVCFENQAQFHPLEFINVLSKDIEIYENTRVLSVHGHIITTDNGVVTAENIIFATHYPFSNVPGFYFIRQHQERSYVLALEGDGVPDRLPGMYYGIDKGGLSLRCAEGRLLFGGGSHRTGKKDKACDYTGYSYIKKQAELLYPDAGVYTMWAAQDCMSHDKVPFIGRYSIFRPYWYVATGFKKWGMTSSMVAAMIISDMISGAVNPYEKVFSPQRVMVRMGIKSYCTDIGESVAGLVKGLFGGKRQRCSHMGCHLQWNEEEHTWDCPCHGSRFKKDGDLVDNPAKHNLSNIQY